MPSVCVDASLFVALVIPEDLTAKAEGLMALCARDGIGIVAPSLVYPEVTSVIRLALSQGRIQPGEAERAFEDFCAIPIAVTPDSLLHRAAWRLAQEFGRPRAYDAFYLAAAREAGCDLWTGDRRLVHSVRVPWVRWIGDFRN